MKRVVRSVPRKRRYLALAILGLAVAAAAAMTTGAVRVTAASAINPDTCGYSGGSTTVPVTNRSLVKFNEIGIIEGFSTTSDADGNPQTVQVFYSDEHALTIGATGTAWSATYNDPPTAIKRIDDAGTNPAGVGAATPGLTPPTLDTGDVTAVDPFGRQVAPSLYLTDVTLNAASKAGDWQNQSGANTTAQRPTYAGGTWKNNGAANPLGSDGKVATNGIDLGPHSETFVDSISTSQGHEAYGAEVRWDTSTLDTSSASGVQAPAPGHTYRVQMMFHDGDHNADTGEACGTFTVPPKHPTGTTTASVSNGGVLTKDAAGNLSVTTSDTGTLSGGTRNAAPNTTATTDTSGRLIFSLYKLADADTGSVDCGLDASGDPVTADPVTTRTVNGTAGTPTGSTGGADNDAGHTSRGVYSTPALTSASAPKLTAIGTYFWTVQYTGNIENAPAAETGCLVSAETFQVSKAPSETITHPHVKITEDINIDLSASASGTAGIKAGDTVSIKLFKGDCTTANHDTGGTQQGITLTRTIQSGDIDPTTGEVDLGQLVYPDDFVDAAHPTAPALVTGSYWWFVRYNGNDQVDPSDDGCTEAFSIALP